MYIPYLLGKGPAQVLRQGSVYLLVNKVSCILCQTLDKFLLKSGKKLVKISGFVTSYICSKTL